MRPIFCISDLHLCDRGPRDNFFARGEERLHRFLDYVEKENCNLYLLGDILETWQSNFSLIVNAYRPLLERLSRMEAKYVVGNHDNTFTAFLNKPDYSEWFPDWFPLPSLPFTIQVGNKRIALAHGDEFDPACADLNPGIGHLTAIMSAMLEDRNEGPSEVEDHFIGSLEWPLNIWRAVTNQNNRLEEMQQSAEQYKIKQKADYLIYGHTHAQGKHNNCFNCGCWCRDQDGFVRIESDGSISMWTWNNDHAEPFNKEL